MISPPPPSFQPLAPPPSSMIVLPNVLDMHFFFFFPQKIAYYRTRPRPPPHDCVLVQTCAGANRVDGLEF